ncbi:MAG: hypothetical protein FOGNACKC_05631 [Anaerolineae bacterium]|nr:hypothetical protein [Anaerolineae bacterium]
MSIRSDSGDVVNGGAGQTYPEGSDLQKFVTNRNRVAQTWLLVFIAATVVAIVALSALLYTIARDAFGYIAVQNTLNPAAVVRGVEEARMLAASNTVSSEDDNELVKGIKNDPYAIGYFGYAYYAENSDNLRLVAVNGVEPSAETAQNGEYAYTRPLYIYTTKELIAGKPQVAGFINYYLNNANQIATEVGYFPAGDEALAQAKQAWLDAAGLDAAGQFPVIEPAQVSSDGPFGVTGSSTVYPVTRQIAINFRRAGYQGAINLEQTGTSAGFEQFCASSKGPDIVDASRAVLRKEVEACDRTKRVPLEFTVGTDALAIVVSQKNDFLKNLSTEQLREVFTDYEKWSDIDPSFPDEPIKRYIPGQDSGTLDFFADETFVRDLEALSAEELVAVLQFSLSPGRINALNAEQPLAGRSQAQLLALVNAEVIKPRVVKSWNLVESIFDKKQVEAETAQIADAELKFSNWLTWEFLTNTQNSIPEYAGIRTAILGSLWVIFITMIVALPLGVGAAIYLEEYATMVSNPVLRRVNGIIQTNINNLAGVPSIIYGLLGLAVFVRAWEMFTSGSMFGLTDATTANGRTIMSAALTLALLILPLLIINAQEAIRAVPQSLRQAGMGLGATKWQTIWHHVLPNAIPGILTGNILAVSRAIGETAPLVVIGASTFITTDPDGPFSKFTTLPMLIYNWTSRPQPEFQHIAAAGIIVLLVLLLSLNAAAVILRNRFSRKLV